MWLELFAWATEMGCNGIEMTFCHSSASRVNLPVIIYLGLDPFQHSWSIVQAEFFGYAAECPRQSLAKQQGAYVSIDGNLFPGVSSLPSLQ